MASGAVKSKQAAILDLKSWMKKGASMPTLRLCVSQQIFLFSVGLWIWGRERNNEIGGRFELIGLPFAPPQRKVMYSTLDRGIKPVEVRETGKGGLQSVDRGESNVEQCRFLHHSHVGLNDQAWLNKFIQESRKRAIVGCIQLMAHLALWRSVWHCVWFMF